MRKIVYPTKSYCSDFFSGSFGGNAISEIERHNLAFRIFKRRGLKKLIIGTNVADYPFSFKDTDLQFNGYSIELGNALGKYFDVDIEYCGYHGTLGMIKALHTKEINLIISSIAINAARCMLVDFSTPYINSNTSIIVSRKKDIKNWKELDQPHIRLAVSYGSVYDNLAQQIFKKANIQKYYGADETGKSLLVGKTDAILDNAIWAKQFEWHNKDKATMLTTNIGKSFLVGIAANKGQQTLLDAINIFVSQYNGSPVQAANYKRWLIGKVG